MAALLRRMGNSGIVTELSKIKGLEGKSVTPQYFGAAISLGTNK